MTFGQYFNKLRRNNKQTLRNFCKEHEFTNYIISAIERELIPPLDDNQLIRAYVKALNIEKYSDEYIKFYSLARRCINDFKKIPQSSEYYAALYELKYYEEKYNESAKKVNHIKEQLEMIKREKQ